MFGIDFDYLLFQFKMLLAFGFIVSPLFGRRAWTGGSRLPDRLRFTRYLLFRLVVYKFA